MRPLLWLESVKLWNWYISHHITLSASYLTVVQNSLGDRLGRHFSTGNKWEIHNSVLDKVFPQWETSHWDLFASQVNRKHPLLLQNSCRQGLKWRCSSATMEGSSQVCFPSSPINSTVSLKFITRELESSLLHPTGRDILVHGSTEAPSYSTHKHLPVSRPSNTTQSQLQVPSPGTTATWGLVFGRALDVECSCSRVVQSILNQSGKDLLDDQVDGNIFPLGLKDISYPSRFLLFWNTYLPLSHWVSLLVTFRFVWQ